MSGVYVRPEDLLRAAQQDDDVARAPGAVRGQIRRYGSPATGRGDTRARLGGVRGALATA